MKQFNKTNEMIEFDIIPQCYHKNGWFKSVTFKWWIFDFRRKFFLCTNCEDLIPLEEAEEIWKNFKDKKKI